MNESHARKLAEKAAKQLAIKKELEEEMYLDILAWKPDIMDFIGVNPEMDMNDANVIFRNSKIYADWEKSLEIYGFDVELELNAAISAMAVMRYCNTSLIPEKRFSYENFWKFIENRFSEIVKELAVCMPVKYM